MTAKSVLDIDINDDRFRAFYELFKDYQDRLGELPEAWKKVDEQTKRAARTAKALAAHSWSAAEFHKMREEMKRTADEQKRFHAYSLRSAIQMHKMAESSKTIAKSFLGVGKTLARMGAWGLGLGAAGLFGLNELGASAVSRQREARGIGLNQGQLKAWHTYMDRFAGSGMLQKVANAQTNPQGVLNLSLASGLSLGRAQRMSPDQLAYRIMLHERQMWKSTPKWTRGVTPGIMAGEQFADQSDIRRWAHSSGAAFSSEWANYQNASKDWNLDRGKVNQWRTLTQDLRAAGYQIENVLTKRLAALAPYMGTFVKTITKDAQALIDSALTPKNIQAFGRGVESLAEYLGSPAFTHKVKDVGSALSDVVDAILWAAKKLKAGSFAAHHPLGTFSVHHDKLPPHATAWQKMQGFVFGRQVFHSAAHPDLQKWSAPVGASGKKGYLYGLDSQFGLPAGTLWGIYGAESSYGKNVGPSSAGAVGPFQMMPDTYKALGVTDPYSFRQEARAAARLMQQNRQMYHGDMRKALAAYNSRPATVNAAVASRGKDWLSAMPAQTQAYVPKVMSGIKIVIDNRAGANVYALANAAGQ